MQMTCRWCPEVACIKQNTTPLCQKHYRFIQMRMKSMTDGKAVPTFEQLDSLVPSDMKCPVCHISMHWRAKQGTNETITLQHDRSGEFRLICFKCNSRHARLEGDSFYALKPGTWPCRRCGSILPIEEFGTESRDGRVVRKTYCKECTRKYLREWEQRNPLKVAAMNARRNERRRAKRAASRNGKGIA